MHHLQHISELGPVLERLGTRHVVIAPGSRNAPLIQLFTSDRRFHCHSVVDERSAAYIALGMCRQLKEPVAVVTTSGTAVMNLSPAVAEAFQQELPLIILTADRPREMLSQFNNQVCDQRAPFFNFSKGFLDLPAEIREEDDMLRGIRAAENLIMEALSLPRGPVHLNLPLTEPLYEKLPESILSTDSIRPDSRGQANESAYPESMEVAGKKVMILAGMGPSDPELKQVLEQLLENNHLVVIAENLSNLGSGHFVSMPELVLAGATDEERGELVPDLVIAFGQQLVSKRLKLFIQSQQDLELIELEKGPGLLPWLKDLRSVSGLSNSYLDLWKKIEEREYDRAKTYFNQADFSMLTAVARILEIAPPRTRIHLGNSTSIRLSQLLRARPDLEYYSNRGISGIDGSLSAAVGAAMVSRDLHLLILGDLSFVYDSNGLWNKDFPENLLILVLNDGGGGIFRLIEGPDRMEFFEEFSVTHHPVSLELLSTAYGRSFARATNMEELAGYLGKLNAPAGKLSIIEVDTTSCDNTGIYKGLFTKSK